LVLRYECPDELPKRNVVVSFAVRDHLGVFLLHHRTNFNNQNFQEIPPAGQFMCRIPELPLVPGRYAVNIFVGINEEPCDVIEDAAQFEVEGGDFFGTGRQGMSSLCRLLVKCDWRLGPVIPGALSGLPQAVERAAPTR
jgi:lipopolysaccharide transport system ATP-binding protein